MVVFPKLGQQVVVVTVTENAILVKLPCSNPHGKSLLNLCLAIIGPFPPNLVQSEHLAPSLWAFRLIYVNRGGGFEAESSTYRCSRGAKVFCCDAGDWKDVIAGGRWTKWYDRPPYSTPVRHSHGFQRRRL